MEDTVDIELSVDDIEKMDPMMIKSIHNKLRQSRADVMSQREELQTELEGMRNKLNREQTRLSLALAREARQQRSLAAVGEKLINLGVLDALSLNKEDVQ